MTNAEGVKLMQSDEVVVFKAKIGSHGLQRTNQIYIEEDKSCRQLRITYEDDYGSIHSFYMTEVDTTRLLEWLQDHQQCTSKHEQTT